MHIQDQNFQSCNWNAIETMNYTCQENDVVWQYTCLK